MALAVAVLVGLTMVLGAGLVWAGTRLPDNADALIDAIDALLPQTQCAQCGYPGCRPYAEAVAKGAALDLCPPGGEETVAALKNLLGEDPGESTATPQSPAARLPAAANANALHDGHSTRRLAANRSERRLLTGIAKASENSELIAKIREPECVGCALCVTACPVDAILGAPGFMHSVLERQCTGCELCLPACPVDCIDLVQAPFPAFIPPAATTGKGRRTRASPNGGDAPCIGCNRCEEVCPQGLAPQHLLRLLRARQSGQAAADGLDACIECRLCDRVCPTQIPLADIFHAAKDELTRRTAKEANAAAAKARFQARTARLAEREAAAEDRRRERLTRFRRQPAMVANRLGAPNSGSSHPTDEQTAIEIERPTA